MYTRAVRKRNTNTREASPKPKPTRSGAPWPRRVSVKSADGVTIVSAVVPPGAERVTHVTLGDVPVAVLGAYHAARAALGREPTESELSARTGLEPSTLRPVVSYLDVTGLTAALSEKKRACLDAIARLEQRLGHSPSTTEVGEEMGCAPSTARFHINGLVRLGLVTPPEVRLVLGVTAAGRALVTPQTNGQNRK